MNEEGGILVTFVYNACHLVSTTAAANIIAKLCYWVYGACCVSLGEAVTYSA
jgi:hypothetical protein